MKGRVFPLITLLVIWTLLLECSSNLKFPRLFPANHPHLSFGRWGCTLHYCQSKMKPCNAQETKSSWVRQKKWFKSSDPASPDFPRRYSQQMASRSSGRLGRQTVNGRCSTSLIIHSFSSYLPLSILIFSNSDEIGTKRKKSAQVSISQNVTVAFGRVFPCAHWFLQCLNDSYHRRMEIVVDMIQFTLQSVGLNCVHSQPICCRGYSLVNFTASGNVLHWWQNKSSVAWLKCGMLADDRGAPHICKKSLKHILKPGIL